MKKIFVFFATAILMFFFAGCYSSKKAAKETKKAFFTYTKQTVDILNTLSPCVTGGSSVSVDSSGYKAGLDSLMAAKRAYDSLKKLRPIVIRDTLEIKNCPSLVKQLELANAEISHQEDYIIDITDKFNRIKPIDRLRVDTVKDTREILSLGLEVLELEKKVSDKDKKIEKYLDQIKSIRKWAIGLGLSSLILLFVVLAGIYLTIKKNAL